MKQMVQLNINDNVEEVWIEPWWTLAFVLREVLGQTGLKVSCETGDCGVCTILIDGKAVRSCLYLAMKARGKKITTIEGLKQEDGGMHPLQESFVEGFAVQCGFCTPGMILSAKALLDENPNPTRKDVKEALRGNLCRCTGYTKILDAVMNAKEKLQ